MFKKTKDGPRELPASQRPPSSRHSSLGAAILETAEASPRDSLGDKDPLS